MLCPFEPRQRKDLSFDTQHVKEFSATKYNTKTKDLLTENIFLRDQVVQKIGESGKQLFDMNHSVEKGILLVLQELDGKYA